MKKAAFVFFLALFSSLVAAASNDSVKKPGDPIKGQPSPQQPSFSLSKGYFSLFDIFRAPVVPSRPDTTKKNTTITFPNSKTESNKKEFKI